MKKYLLLAALLVLPLAGIAQEAKTDLPPTVNVSSKGTDVRNVLHDLFKQANKNFVAEPNIHFALYLSLDGVEFEEALNVVCDTANLKFEKRNGIFYISKKPAPTPAPKAEAKPTPPPAPKGKLPENVLQKRITTRYKTKDIRELFDNLGKQSNLTIEVAKEVPAYKLDAFLIDTSLKYALDQITGAAKLKYKFTENQTILIYSDAPQNRVSVVTTP